MFSLDQEELESFRLTAMQSHSAGRTQASEGFQLQDAGASKHMEKIIPAHLANISNMFMGTDESAPGTSQGSFLKFMGQDEIDADERLQIELSKLRTGEDVIAFFAKNGAHTPVKFVYCQRKTTEETEFRPYDLVVIAEAMEATQGSTAQIMVRYPEHFTISATGVVCVSPGQASEHMSLAEWMHQSLMYSVLTSMNFFKFYIHRKVFGRWRQYSRYTVYCNQRMQLSQHLFLTKPLFVGSLVKIQSEMFDVESVKVMNIGTNLYQLDEFADTQYNVRSNPTTGAMKEFDARHLAVVTILDRLVNSVNRSTQESGRATTRSNARPKMKSMVQEKEEKRESARRYRIAKHDQSLLGDFIRLVDYMFQASLVRAVVHAMLDFHQRLESSNKMFSISVSFADYNMVFDPSLNDFFNMLIICKRVIFMW
jgi:dynein heavy chain